MLSTFYQVSKRNNILTIVKNFTFEYKRINQYQFSNFIDKLQNKIFVLLYFNKEKTMKILYKFYRQLRSKNIAYDSEIPIMKAFLLNSCNNLIDISESYFYAQKLTNENARVYRVINFVLPQQETMLFLSRSLMLDIHLPLSSWQQCGYKCAVRWRTVRG